jgi:hypothetical protein
MMRCAMKNIPLVMLIIYSGSIIACQQKSGHEPNLSHPTKQKKAAKPGAAVSLASANMLTLTANQPSPVIVLLKANANAEIIQVEINPSEGLQLVSGAKVRDLHVDTDGLYHLPMSILASDNGRYYLNITINNKEYSSSRALAVIIQVGALAEADTLPEKMLKSTLNESIISLPAEESIQHQ